MIRCDLCPHHCVLKEGQTGFCHQRMNKEGSIVLKDYGAITSLSLDPIERSLSIIFIQIQRFYLSVLMAVI